MLPRSLARVRSPLTVLNYVGNVGLKVSGKKAAMPFARWFHEISTVLLLPLTHA